jgi:hypothetical protein
MLAPALPERRTIVTPRCSAPQPLDLLHQASPHASSHTHRPSIRATLQHPLDTDLAASKGRTWLFGVADTHRATEPPGLPQQVVHRRD